MPPLVTAAGFASNYCQNAPREGSAEQRRRYFSPPSLPRKGPGPLNIGDVSGDAAWRSPLEQRSFAEYLAYFLNEGVTLPPMARLPGFTTDLLQVDFMHTDLGAWIAANSLIELVEEGAFGVHRGAWKIRVNRALRRAFIEFKTWAADQRVDQSQPSFNFKRLTMSKAGDWPEFKGKTHNTMVVCFWLCDFVLRRTCDTTGHRLRTTVLVSYRDMHQMMRSCGDAFSSEEADLFYSVGNKMLLAYACRSRLAQDLGQARWQIKPKHHHMCHGVSRAQKSKRNPRSQWLFKHESFVGAMCKVGAKTHANTASVSACKKWCLGWAVRATGTNRRRGGRIKHHFKRRRVAP